MIIQLLLALFIILIAIGALISPELGTYALQLIALIALFSIAVRRLQKKEQQTELTVAKKDEQTLLFLTTEMKPALEKMKNQDADAPTPQELLQKVDSYIKKN